MNRLYALSTLATFLTVRYTEHEIFNQQIAIADVIVGNKSDLYQEADRNALQAYASERGAPHAKLLITEQGALELAWLQGATQAEGVPPHHHHQDSRPSINEMPIPESGYLKVENQGEGFKSVGWRFESNLVFERSKLFSFLAGLSAERMKAAFITQCGIFGYNLTKDGLTEISLGECGESRVEIIAEEIDAAWEQLLLDCMLPN